MELRYLRSWCHADNWRWETPLSDHVEMQRRQKECQQFHLISVFHKQRCTLIWSRLMLEHLDQRQYLMPFQFHQLPLIPDTHMRQASRAEQNQQ